MYRRDLSEPPPWERDRLGDSWQDAQRMVEANPVAGADERPVLSICPVCFKDLVARELCDRCGEDVAA